MKRKNNCILGYYENMEVAYDHEILSHKILSEEETRVCIYKIQNGDKTAEQNLVLGHLRLVKSWAQRSLGRGLEMPDLMQEGCIGLIIAARKFDLQKENTFGTYATWHIRSAINRALQNTSSLVRVPAHIYCLINKYKVLKNRLETIYGKNIPRELFLDALKIEENTLITIENYVYAYNICSLDKKVVDEQSEEKTCCIKDYIIDEEQEPLENMVIQKIEAETIDALLLTLDEKQKIVLSMNYGLAGKEATSLAEAGKQMGFTRERARQIHNNAIQKLKTKIKT